MMQMGIWFFKYIVEITRSQKSIHTGYMENMRMYTLGSMAAFRDGKIGNFSRLNGWKTLIFWRISKNDSCKI